MAYRMRVHELATVIKARRELAAEVRDLADLLDSQEPDHLALHDAWEVLLDLAEQAESVRAEFFSRHPEQEAWLIEKRPWLDPKLQLIGKPSRSPQSRRVDPGENASLPAARAWIADLERHKEVDVSFYL